MMDCFDCIFSYIHGRFSLFNTNVRTGFMISLFLVAPALRLRRAKNVFATSVRNKLRFLSFFFEGVLFSKLSFLINNLFGNVFQISEVIGSIKLLDAKPRK